MSRARRSHSSSLQLFPFLAVLVSALGALVLLLLAINRQVSLQSIAAAAQALAEQTTAEENALADRRHDLEQHLGSLHIQIDRVRAEQRAVDQSLTANDNQARTGGAQSQAMRGDLDRIRKSRVEAEQRIALLRQEIDALRAARDQLASKRRDPERTFVPIVHPGSNGTARQPIYLECTERGVIFQPEGIVLPTWLLKTDQGQAMLAHAIQSLVEHYAARDSGKRADRLTRVIEPYPLLLVRPAGAWVFYAVRQALDSLNFTFGYELVEADWAFQFPELDPTTQALLAECLEPSRETYASGAGASVGQFGGSGQPGGASGRMSLTPGLGRLLGLEQAVDRNTGGGTGNSRPNTSRPLGQVASGSPVTDSAQPHGASERSSDPIAGSSPRIGPARDGATLSSAEYHEGRPSNAVARPRGEGTVDSLRNGTAVAADSNQHSGSRGDATSDLSIRPFQAAPNEKQNEKGTGTREPGSGTDLSAALQSSGIGAGRRVPASAEDADEQMGSLSLPAPGGRISIGRSIEIVCRSGSLHVGNRPVYFGAADAVSLRSGMGAIVQELQQVMATWEPAGATFRWQPKLLCVVHSGGLEMYYGLRTALVGSSIHIDHVIAAEDEVDLSDSLFLDRARFQNQDSKLEERWGEVSGKR